MWLGWIREVCPLGPFYLPAYAEGVRAGIKELGPHLIGYDPRQLSLLNHRMDAALKGHAYVKSGIDIACWDILGKATVCRCVCCWVDVLARAFVCIARSRKHLLMKWHRTSPVIARKVTRDFNLRSAVVPMKI